LTRKPTAAAISEAQRKAFLTSAEKSTLRETTGARNGTKRHTRKRGNPASETGNQSNGLENPAHKHGLFHNRRGSKPPLHQDGGRGNLRL